MSNKVKIAIFFDDGGVMNDNERRGEQWKDLIADYFCPRYGGDPEAWREGNELAIAIITEKLDYLFDNNIDMVYDEYLAYEDKISIECIFDHVGIKTPPENEYSKICREIENWVAPQVRSDIQGIIPVIKELKMKGYELYTASGESSWLLKGYLAGMGILELFNRNLYGPDLTGVMKGGREFYRRMFLHARINPSRAIVIDDKPEMLKLAEQLGALTIQSCVLNEPANDQDYYADPCELPSLVESMTRVTRD